MSRKLLDLPNEILECIVNKIHRDDIESFAASCKPISKLCKAALDLHRSRKRFQKTRVVTSFSGYKSAQHFQKEHPFQILKKFLDDKDLIPYVSTLHLKGKGEGDWRLTDDSGYNEADLSQDPRIILNKAPDDTKWHDIQAEILLYQDKIGAFLSDCHFGAPHWDSDQEQAYAEGWMNKIMNGHKGAIISFLAAQLSEVEELIIERYPCGQTALMTMVENIEPFNRIRPFKCLAFGKLTTLELRGCGNGHDWTPFRLLANLPTLKKFTGENLLIGWSVDGRLPDSIEEIDLSYCDMHWNMHSGAFGNATSLKKFSFHSTLHGEYDEWNPKAIVDWLKTGALNALEELEITNESMIKWDTIVRGKEYLGSLRDFTALNTLRISILASATADKVKPLASILPASLVTLSLAGVENKGKAKIEKALFSFRGLDPPARREERERLLPNLDLVMFDYPDPSDKVCDRIDALGVKVSTAWSTPCGECEDCLAHEARHAEEEEEDNA